VDVLNGYGRLNGKSGSQQKVSVTDKDGKVQTVLAGKVILATGARARVLPGLEPDGKDIWTYKEAMVPKALPKSLLVIGSGAIGMEFASFYNTLGVDVTVIELLDRILPVEDEEVSKFARKAFEGKGIKVHTGATVKKLHKSGTGVEAEILFQGGKAEKQAFDKVIVAVGIVGNTEDLGLEGTKVKVEKNQVKVDGFCQTEEPGVYAIGDMAGAPWLAHKASHEGVMVAEHIAGVKGVHPMNRLMIPGCTYSSPQVASVGLTEAQAKEKGYKLKVGRFPFIGNGKALALGEPEGFVKTIFDEKTGELLGAHMIGTEVTELIQGFTIAKTMEATEAELMQTIFPHPTLSEMMHESVLDAYGRVIHM
jgi:dihydrolipoamide dehydrogenase